jgi:outer membrane protein TolC
MANAERHREQVQARVDAGTAPRSDLLPVDVEVAQARLASVKADANLDTDYANLKALLQIPVDQQVDLTDPLPNEPFSAKLDDLLCVGETNRPDFAAQKLTIRAAQLATRVAQAQAGLQFDATATANAGNHTVVTGESWQLQVGANYPLFDAGSSKAGVTAAKANQVSAEQKLQSMRLTMQRDTESSYLLVKQSAIAVEVAAVGTRSAESSLAAAEARYQEGLAIIIEVTDAQVQLLQAQVAEIQARDSYASALAQLAFATGTDLQTVPAAAPAAIPATGENK